MVESASSSSPPSTRSIFKLWVPLALTWLMMAMEGPILAAIIARLADPKFNLGAYGVAFAFALLLEAPIIMMLTASTALVKNRLSYSRLLRFSRWLNVGCTVATLLLITPWIFAGVVGFLRIPAPVADVLHGSLALLIPWPAAIGVRRFYQGILIRHQRSHYVTIGAVCRLVGMLGTALLLALFTDIPGAHVGCAGLSAGVTLEAFATWILARPIVASLSDARDATSLSLGEIWRFYYPLALTSSIALASQPMITLVIGWCVMPVESLAVMPVIGALIFIFRGLGLSFQEVAVTFMQDDYSGFLPLIRFAKVMTAVFVVTICLIAFTPLARLWFANIAGLSSDLVDFAITPFRWMVAIPMCACVVSVYRAVAVTRKTSRVITAAVCMEVTIMFLIMLTLAGMGYNGAIAACCGMAAGRLMSCLFFEWRRETSFRRLWKDVRGRHLSNDLEVGSYRESA